MTQRCISMPYLPDSGDYFKKVRHLPWPVWLDSGRPLQQKGRYDIISAAPESTLTSRAGITLWDKGKKGSESFENFWTALKTAQAQHETDKQSPMPFNGGAIGFIGYDIGRQIESLDDVITDSIDCPGAQLGFYHWALIQDHKTKSCTLIAHSSITDEKINTIEQLIRAPYASAATQIRVGSLKHNTSHSKYIESIKTIKDYILSGDCYQVNYSQRFDMPYDGDPFVAYQSLRKALPSQYSAYFEPEGNTLLSLSPECFLTTNELGNVKTKPIKGTIPRGNNKAEDAALATTLQSSTKDRAENLMIVDLLRNDLSKSCEPHSVKVQQLFDLESYANVHHLVSTVEGKLKEEACIVDLIRNCFPGGSITGAPKKRAMEIIEELESSRRSIYCGSMGHIGYDGKIDLNITIRSLLCTTDTIHCWSGGGIVADSDPQSEYEESLSKISVLTSTLSKQFSAD